MFPMGKGGQGLEGGGFGLGWMGGGGARFGLDLGKNLVMPLAAGSFATLLLWENWRLGDGRRDLGRGGLRSLDSFLSSVMTCVYQE